VLKLKLLQMLQKIKRRNREQMIKRSQKPEKKESYLKKN
jgi:hypothetical protein